jgi:hypothetical protein
MTLMSGDGGGEAPGMITLQRNPTASDTADASPVRPPGLSARGGLAAAVVIAMIAAAIFQQGGFYPTDAFGLAVVSAILVVALLRHARDKASVRVAAAVCGLTVWWLLRSIAAHRTIAFFPLGAAFLGFLAGFLAVRWLGERDRTRVVMALVSLGAVTALLGLVGVLWHVTSWAQNQGGFWELATPLTQPEAAAALLCLTLLVGLALDLERALVRIALCIMLAGFIATQSHWSVLALVAGALFVPRRRWLSAWWPLIMGWVSGAAVIVSASGHLAPWVGAAVLAAATVAAPWRCEVRTVRRIGAERAALIGVVALAVVALGTTLLVLRPPGIVAPRQPADQSQTVAWSGAAHAWRSSTLIGVAPPTIFASSQPVDAYPGVAPDTDTTVVAQGGLIGAALLALGMVAVAAVRGRRSLLSGCALGATVAFVVAGVVDVAWELPAVAIIGGCVAGLWARAPAGPPAESAGTAARPLRAPSRYRITAWPAGWALGLAVLLAVQLAVGFNHGAAGGLAHEASAAPPPAATPLAPARTILQGSDETDPYMLSWQGHDIIYTSEGTTYLNVPVRVGTPGHWGPVADALPDLPKWATGGATWAPDVHQVAGGWALYFTALLRGASMETHCIGDAFSSSPTGPFIATERPFICQLDHRGSIDARVISDDGHLVMLWKSEDNADPGVPGPDQNGETGIYSQYLSADGRTLTGQPVKILSPSQQWEGTIVEAPDMVEAWGTYWLFFSGNWYYSSSYGIGAAACQSPMGPCADVDPTPFIGTNLQGSGPGEESLFAQGGNVWLLYNPFKADDPGPVVPRPAVMVRLGFTPQGPYLAAP